MLPQTNHGRRRSVSIQPAAAAELLAAHPNPPALQTSGRRRLPQPLPGTGAGPAAPSSTAASTAPKPNGSLVLIFRSTLVRILLVVIVFFTVVLWRRQPPLVHEQTSSTRPISPSIAQQLPAHHEYYVPDSVSKKPRQTSEERRFLQSLPLLKPPDLPPKVKFYDDVTAEELAKTQRLRRFRLSDFQYCRILNGAVFDAFVHIDLLGGDVATINPPAETLINIMDDVARNVTKFIMTKFENVNPVEAQRYACYAVAEGNNPSANFTDTRFVHSFNPDAYFSPVLPAISHNAPDVLPSRKRYLIAFFIMVHETAGFQQLKMLLDVLDDGNAIILIHVDKTAHQLQRLISDHLVTREKLRPNIRSNVFLTKNRFANVWGHISLVFTQLSGFWELANMADWDYIINLSNYDWPLRSNPEMHRVLELHQGYSWIDYWNDTEAVAERTLRPHLGTVDHTSVYHPPELGITSWPFSHWKAYKQMQWMILSRSAVRFFRTDRSAINYLAFMEHTYMPEESFFATALVNSRRHSMLLKRDKKRYVRSRDDISSPAWIGWSDRHIFRPASGKDDPEFLFLRPFNVLGEFFGETRLLEWIRQNHLTLDPSQTCQRDQIGHRDECIHEIASPIADNQELVVVPVNMAYMDMVDNLRCSLLRAGIRNVLYWSLDIQTHDKLIELGLLSFFVPSIRGSPHKYQPNTKEFVEVMRYKPIIIQRLLNAGFHVIFLDADTVVTKDFRTSLRRHVQDPTFADVAVAMAEVKRVQPTTTVKVLPKANAGIIYFRNTKRTKKLLDNIIGRQEADPDIDDQEALRQILAQPRQVVWTGIGIPESGAYPGSDLGKSDPALVQSSSTGSARDDARIHGAAAALGSFAGLFGMNTDRTGLHNGDTHHSSLHLNDDGRIRVHFLDQFEFISGDLYFNHHNVLPPNFRNYRIIHANGQSDPKSSFKTQNLWFVDDSGNCLETHTSAALDYDGDDVSAIAGVVGDAATHENLAQEAGRNGEADSVAGVVDAGGKADAGNLGIPGVAQVSPDQRPYNDEVRRLIANSNGKNRGG